MTSLEETVHALARRVADLERDNERLKAGSTRHRGLSALAGEPSRRGLLIGGAGIAGVLAGNAFTRADRVMAESDQLAAPRIVGVRTTVLSEHGGGNHAARYVWDLAGSFTSDEPPVVVAVAHDNHLFANAGSELTCVVEVRREAGAWHAAILVNHVAHLATEVTINAIALGTT